MSMFTSYDNLPADYVPHNTVVSCVTFDSIEGAPPRAVYNAKGKQTGYSWCYGEVFDLKISSKITVNVSGDAIIYEAPSLGPEVSTPGVIGQVAYNLIDIKSWTCTSVVGNTFTWEENDIVLYPSNGTKLVTFEPVTEQDTLEFTLYNYRWVPVKTYAAFGANNITCSIDAITSEELKPSIYYGILKVTGPGKNQILDKFKFTVK